MAVTVDSEFSSHSHNDNVNFYVKKYDNQKSFNFIVQSPHIIYSEDKDEDNYKYATVNIKEIKTLKGLYNVLELLLKSRGEL